LNSTKFAIRYDEDPASHRENSSQRARFEGYGEQHTPSDCTRLSLDLLLTTLGAATLRSHGSVLIFYQSLYNVKMA
jgi:hypothetical protein